MSVGPLIGPDESAPGSSVARFVPLLRFLGTNYLRARQETDDLQVRLRALEEQSQGWGPSESASSPKTGGGMTELDRVRRSVERSAFVASERMRALELVVSACVGVAASVVDKPGSRRAPPSPGPLLDPPAGPARRPPAPDDRAATPAPPPTEPVELGEKREDPLRGSWSAPSG